MQGSGPPLNSAGLSNQFATLQLQKTPRRSGKCAEVILDLFLIESVRFLEEQEKGPAASAALEAVGMRVGKQLAERYTKERPRIGDPLDVIKFICKEFWLSVFKKQVDNLRTNHRGVYVLLDNNFRWLHKIPATSSAAGDPVKEEAIKQMAISQLYLPCGILRGALIQLGVICTVEADPKASPACAFTVRLSPT